MTQKPDATRIAGITPAHDKETRTRLPANGAGFFIPTTTEKGHNMITDHVRPAQSIRAITDPHTPAPRHCSVCNRELPAGYVKHRECR